MTASTPASGGIADDAVPVEVRELLQRVAIRLRQSGLYKDAQMAEGVETLMADRAIRPSPPRAADALEKKVHELEADLSHLVRAAGRARLALAGYLNPDQAAYELDIAMPADRAIRSSPPRAADAAEVERLTAANARLLRAVENMYNNPPPEPLYTRLVIAEAALVELRKYAEELIAAVLARALRGKDHVPSIHAQHAALNRLEIALATQREAVRTAGEIAEEERSARDVLAERERQKTVEGWTPEHDDQHKREELAYAAMVYADPQSAYMPFEPSHWPRNWPYKTKDYRSNLVKAGALIIAEIERLDRAVARQAHQDQREEGGR